MPASPVNHLLVTLNLLLLYLLEVLLSSLSQELGVELPLLVFLHLQELMLLIYLLQSLLSKLLLLLSSQYLTDKDLTSL